MKKLKLIWLLAWLAFILSICLFSIPANAIAPEIQVDIPKKIQGTIKEYAYKQVVNRWGKEYWNAFDNIIERESQWNPLATNPESTALGLGQLLLGTHKAVGCKQTFNAEKQIDCAIRYISERYENPKTAWKFWLKNKWY